MTASPDLDEQFEKNQADLAAKVFREFFKQAWHVIEPATEFTPNWHIDAECDHAQAVTEGRIQNLIVNQPPRTLKSSIWSVAWPAWVWIKRPQIRWVFSSYHGPLSLRDSVACQRLIESPWYQHRWGSRFRLMGDQNVKSHYDNDKGGRRIATSVNSGNTGWGGHVVVCLAPGSVLDTDVGQLRVEDIVDLEIPVKVRSFDHATGAPEWQPIEAFESSIGRECVTVHCSDGSALTTTTDHPYFSLDRGYVNASELVVGEQLVSLQSVRSAVQSCAWTCKAPEAPLLQQELCWPEPLWREESPVSRRQGNRSLLQLRQGDSAEAIQCEIGSSVLLAGMSGAVRQGSQAESRNSGSTVRDLFRNGSRSPAEAGRQAGVLLTPVSGNSAQSKDAGDRERSIRPRSMYRGLPERVQTEGSADSEARRESLSVMLDARESQGSRRPSHRLRQDEQCGRESDHPLQVLSRFDARRSEESKETYKVTVIAIERAATPSRVYNVRVAKNHNYFANGILVHNCDDPNGANEGDAVRHHTIDWWDQTMSSRLDDKRTGSRVVIQQRVHEDDLSGHLLVKGGWDHLCIPAEFEGRRKQTTIGWVDPRSRRGELLYGDAPNSRLGPVQIAEFKRDLGAYAYAGQFQQRPSPAEGGIIKRHWFRYWSFPGQPLPAVTVRMAGGEYRDIHALPLPTLEEEAQSWDCTFKKLDTSDFVAGGHWGRRGADKFLLDCVYERLSFTETLKAIRKMSADAPRASLKLIEDKANGSAVIDTLRSEIAGIVPVSPQDGKMARASAVSPQIEAGNIYLPHPIIAPWVDAFLDQCAAFPNASHDDYVDMLSQMLLRWQTHSGIFHTSEQSVVCQPMNIPQTWKRSAAMVVRGDKVSAVWGATDPSSGTIYLTMEYVRDKVDPLYHASTLAMHRWMPFTITVPDLSKDDERKVAQRYRSLGVKAMDAPGEPEAFLQDLTQAMGVGRFKVFSQLAQWIEQFRLAGNQQDKAIEVKGDLIIATCLLFGARERMQVSTAATGRKPDGLPPRGGPAESLGITWA